MNDLTLTPNNEEQQLTTLNQSPEEAVEYAKRCAELAMGAIKPIPIQGKQYLGFESWQVLGRFYGLTSGIEWTKKIKDENGTDVFLARALIYDRNGVVVGSGEGECSKAERNWKNRDEYALRSMAQTRAQSKAFRGMLSWVAVLAGYEAVPAEEMPRDNGHEEPFPDSPPREHPTQPPELASQQQRELLESLLLEKKKKLPEGLTIETISKKQATTVIKQLIES